MITLIRFIAKMLLIMFALPALGLIAFHGGYGSGFLASLLISVVGITVTVFLIPVLATAGLLATVGGGVLAGQLGVRLVSFAIETTLYSITLGLVAWMMSSVALVGFWPTVGAAAILAFVSNVLTPHRKR